MIRVEEGAIVMKDGMGWGLIYDDGRTREEGWVVPAKAFMQDPKYCTEPSDVTWEGSPYLRTLEKAKIVKVRRTTVIEVEYL